MKFKLTEEKEFINSKLNEELPMYEVNGKKFHSKIVDGKLYFASNLDNLQEVLNNCTIIGKLAFQNYPKIKVRRIKDADGKTINDPEYKTEQMITIIIPKNIKVIEEKGFAYFSRLFKVKFAQRDDQIKFGSCVFTECPNLEHVELYKTIDIIPDGLCENCRNLKTVNFSKLTNVRSIERGAFNSCHELANISIPNTVQFLGKYAFCHNYNGFEHLKLPYGITEIPEGTFEDIRLLKSVTIPDSVITIGDKAFMHAVNLKTINYRDNEGKRVSNINTIEKMAFFYCYDLTENSFKVKDSKNPQKLNVALQDYWKDYASDIVGSYVADEKKMKDKNEHPWKPDEYPEFDYEDDDEIEEPVNNENEPIEEESLSEGMYENPLSAKQRKLLNKIVNKYNGWHTPREISKLWDELLDLGVEVLIKGYPDDIAEDGAESWTVIFDLNGEECDNSRFVYSVYKGDEEKNEYNMYFS